MTCRVAAEGRSNLTHISATFPAAFAGLTFSISEGELVRNASSFTTRYAGNMAAPDAPIGAIWTSEAGISQAGVSDFPHLPIHCEELTAPRGSGATVYRAYGVGCDPSIDGFRVKNNAVPPALEMYPCDLFGRMARRTPEIRHRHSGETPPPSNKTQVNVRHIWRLNISRSVIRSYVSRCSLYWRSWAEAL